MRLYSNIRPPYPPLTISRTRSPIYKKYNVGTTVWSPLASGLLTGKYNEGIPEGSRFANHAKFFKSKIDALSEEDGKAKLEKVRELTKLAEDELGCSVGQLAIAWVARNPNTSTVIIGASKPEQGISPDDEFVAQVLNRSGFLLVIENLKAVEVIPKLTPDVMEKIEKILNNKPSPPVRPPSPRTETYLTT